MKWRSFEDAKKFLQKNKLMNRDEFVKFKKSGKLPNDIPKDPRFVYKKEWEGWGDFLGTGFVATTKREFRSFEKARKFVRKLKLKNQKEWRQFNKSAEMPFDIPMTPHRVYKKEWKNMGDWLGTGRMSNKDKEFWSYQKSRQYLIKHGINSKRKFEKLCKEGKKPNDMPTTPARRYKKEWRGWADFLGTKNIPTHEQAEHWLSANEARIAIKNIAKKIFGGKPFTPKDWEDAYDEGKIPRNLPKYLDYVYNPDVKQNRRRKKK